MKRIENLILLSLISLAFTACNDDDIRNYPNCPFGCQLIMETTLLGQIIDDHDDPISGARVTFKSGESEITVLTDEYGSFSLQNVTNRGYSAYISVSAPGKFNAFRRFGVLPDRFNYTTIKMNDRKVVGSIEAESGGTIENDEGAKVALPANGIINADGLQHQGKVNVAMAWINPEADDLIQRMVGDLSGIDADGRNSALMTYGMLQVELTDDFGNELNLSSDHQAELSFPIPPAMMSGAKAEIPLWIYDEEAGTWIQENTAYLDGSFYKGMVSHFSSFNVDFKTDPIEIVGVVKIENTIGQEDYNLSYLQIRVESERIRGTGGYLCNDGAFRFFNFPKNEIFTLKIVNRCGEVIFEQEYGPFTEDQDLGCISVPANIEDMVFITGNAVDCNQVPIDQGTFHLELGTRRVTYPMTDDGSIAIALDICSATEAEFYVVEYDPLTKSEINMIEINSDDIDIGTIELCDTISEFIKFNISDGHRGFFGPNINLTRDLADGFNFWFITIRSVTDNADSSDVALRFQFIESDIPPSPFTNQVILANQFSYYSEEWDREDSFSYHGEDITTTFELYDSEIGGRVKGYFTGTVTKNGTQNEEYNIEGSFDFTVR